jgi:hypothetical protein
MLALPEGGFMITVLMLDLGETLIHQETTFPNVVEALDALSRFETADGKPLILCLVSDFEMPVPPPTKEKIKTIFQKYIALLDGFGLKHFFEPVERCVTLSAHAGVFKPERKVFETALKRLKVAAKLEECLFITENAEHIQASQEFGMKTLRFGSPGDFSDWSEAPLLIAKLVAPDSDLNLQLALNVRLAVTHELTGVMVLDKEDDRKIHSQAQQWVSVSQPGEESLAAQVPGEVDIELDAKGRIRSVEVAEPDPEMLEEFRSFAESLKANQQISRGPGSMLPGATHKIETDEKGRRRLVRKRFSAI